MPAADPLLAHTKLFVRRPSVSTVVFVSLLSRLEYGTELFKERENFGFSVPTNVNSGKWIITPHSDNNMNMESYSTELPG